RRSILAFFLSFSLPTRPLHSFPTRRSSDLPRVDSDAAHRCASASPWTDKHALRGHVSRPLSSSAPHASGSRGRLPLPARRELVEDRKSTRLNSSHLGISYAVFCLKKKKHIN